MSKKNQQSLVRLDKFVHGGQCLAVSEQGKKVFVWGGLPGEIVDIEVVNKKRSYLEGVVTKVHKPSSDRILPKEPLSFISTSPWQIVSFEAENIFKQAILKETFEREGLSSIKWSDFYSGVEEFGYRNKIEIGFWGDEQGLHLAHYKRASHGKQIVEYNSLARDCINQAARDVRDELKKLEIWAGKLKTLVLRCNQADQVVGALFMKEELDMAAFKLPNSLLGLDIYFSDPKSPASVPTKKLYSFGDITLVDSISGINITYDVLSFFQVNLPVFEVALVKIKKILKEDNSIDLYSGVGTIGVVSGSSKLIEADENNCKYAVINSKGTDTEVISTTSEKALDNITQHEAVIFDPPRAGLHRKLIERLAEVRPPQIVYLSCNPVTQARDVKMLESTHKIVYAQGFNFFPKTPHIESLLVLERIEGEIKA